MTQRKEKTGICKSVVIATVVAIRDVVKNGFHCTILSTDEVPIVDQKRLSLDKILAKYF